MNSASMHVAAVLVWVTMLPASRAATSRDILSEASIALRCEGARLLIIGEVADEKEVERLTRGGLNSFPRLQINAAFSPGEVTFEITAKIFHALMGKQRPGFEIGARWQLYPGAGSPATLVIEKLVLLYHGDCNRYLGAFGRVISEAPMVRVDQVSLDVANLLFDRGRDLVRDDNWQTEGITDAEEIKRAREMNHAFLALGKRQAPEIRMWRWAPDVRKPLLFVEAVWIDEERNRPLFAVDAVVQERGAPAILSFNYKKAEWMRWGEGSDRDWKLHTEDAAFLNAWKIGPESYILTYIAGYEGYSVELQRVDSAKGLVTALGFGQ